LPDQFYAIQDSGNPVTDLTWTFSDFTDASGAKNCGDRKYTIVSDSGLTALTLDSDTRTFDFATSDKSFVGVYDVTVAVSLKDFPQFDNDIMRQTTFKFEVSSCSADNEFYYTPASIDQFTQ